MISNPDKKIKILIVSAAVAIQFFSVSYFAKAAVILYFRTDKQEIRTGETFTVDLEISSKDKSINVIDGTLTFDKNKIQVQGINTDKSLFSIWQTPPVFHNDSGKITFVGGIPGGFKGPEGEVLEITFLAKNAGNAKISFQDIFSVFVNDGSGTRLNPWFQSFSVTVAREPINIAVKNTIQTLIREDEKYNHLPLVFLIILFAGMVVVIINIRSRKKSKKSD